MKRLLILIFVSAVISGCDGNCFASTFRWGIEPAFRWGVEPSDQSPEANEFGLGIFAKVQDYCPGGNCPTGTNVYQQSWRWSPPLRPRTTVQRSVTQYSPACPSGAFSVAGLPPGAVLVSVKDEDGNELLASAMYSNCPNCPGSFDFRSVARQWAERRSTDWTWPGDIDAHLRGAPHFVPQWQLNQMTFREKVDLHNADHNGRLSKVGANRPRMFRRDMNSNTPRLFNGPVARAIRSRRGW